jgi:hypothetical protein
MAALTQDLDENVLLPGKGVFGGTIQFIVTKNLSALGPTWSLVGPGPLVSMSEINTDKLTFAFARGGNAGKRMETPLPRELNADANQFLQQLIVQSISSDINGLRNSLLR